jgi:branched-chain amino acid transport system permease protein
LPESEDFANLREKPYLCVLLYFFFMIPLPVIIGGSIYASLVALITLGFSLTYATSKFPNFAHGAFVSIGMYTTYHLTDVMGIVPAVLPSYSVMIVAFFVTGIASLVVYVVVLGVLKKRGTEIIGIMITTIAIELVIISSLRVYLATLGGSYTGIFTTRELDFTLFDLPGVFYVAFISSTALMIVFHLLLTRTTLGTSMRAAMENADLAEVYGVDVEKIQRISWFFSGGLAGLGGSVLPMWFLIEPRIGSIILLTVFASAILGGITNIYGAIIGSYIVGLMEIAGTYVVSDIFGSWVIPYRPLVPLIILSITLLLAPQGIAGIVERIDIRRRLRQLRGSNND